jgi:hypothetical protein
MEENPGTGGHKGRPYVHPYFFMHRLFRLRRDPYIRSIRPTDARLGV